MYLLYVFSTRVYLQKYNDFFVTGIRVLKDVKMSFVIANLIFSRRKIKSFIGMSMWSIILTVYCLKCFKNAVELA